MTVTDVTFAGEAKGMIFKFEIIKSLKLKNKDMITTNSTNKASVKFKDTEVSDFNVNDKKIKRLIPPYGKEELSFNPITELITPDFVPEALNLMYMDPNRSSFVINPKDITNLKENLKGEASRKMHIGLFDYRYELPPLTKDGTNSVESGDSSSSYSDESIKEELNSIVTNNKINDNSNHRLVKSNSILKKDNNILQKRNTANRVNFSSNTYTEPEYYKVNMNKIKFFIYDYKKETLIELNGKHRVSQIEYKKLDNTKQLFKNSDIQTNSKRTNIMNPYNNSNNFYNSNNPISQMINKSIIVQRENKNENMSLEDSIIGKQIEHALMRQESLVETTRMYYLNLGTFISFVCLFSVFLVLFGSYEKVMQKNIEAVQKSYKLVSNNLIGLFSVRELLISADDRFTNFDGSRIDNYNKIANNIKTLFTDNYNTTDKLNVISYSISIGNNRIGTENNNYIEIRTLGNNSNNIKEDLVNITLSSALADTNSILYDIGSFKIEDILQSNKAFEDVF